MKRLKGWKICLKPNRREGYCWQKQKKIDIGLDNSNPLRLLLHEVAHIGINPHGNKHTQEWFNEYLSLLDKYIPRIGISKSDEIIRRTYGLVYPKPIFSKRRRAKICKKCYYGTITKKNYCRMGIKQTDTKYYPKRCKYFKKL